MFCNMKLLLEELVLVCLELNLKFSYDSSCNNYKASLLLPINAIDHFKLIGINLIGILNTVKMN